MFDDVDQVLGTKGRAEEDEGLGKPTPVEDLPDELVMAAGAILAAMGQDYGMAKDAPASRKAEFWDKARRVAAPLRDFFELCDSLPHAEGAHLEGEDDGQ